MSFDFYRRRQREVLAILVLVAIFSFIIVPSIQLYQSDSSYRSSDAGQVVVKWRGGEMRRDELMRTVQAKAQTVNLLSQVASEVIKRGGMPNVPGFRYDFQNGQIQSLGISGQFNELAVVRSRLLNEKARRLGIVFDDVAVDTFISDFTNGKISSKELKKYMEDVSGGTLSRFRLYQVLKGELGAATMETMALVGLNASGNPILSPGQAWQYFERVSRQARIEAFPVLVSDFIDKVKEEPSESEVEALYEKYKNQFSSPTSAEPGFRKRYATNMEIIELSMDPFVEKEVAKLSEDQIRAEYQRRVEQGQYRRPAKTSTPATETTPPAAGEATPTTTPPAAETPATPPATDKPAEPAKPEEPATPAPPTAETPATPATDNPPATDTPPAPAETPAAPAAEENGGPEPGKADNGALPANTLRTKLVAFQEPAPAETPAATEPAPATPAPEATTPQEPAAPQPAAAPAATEPAATAQTTPPPVEQPPTLEENAANEGTPAQPAEEVIPFEEVKEELARSMVLNDARTAMQAAVALVEQPMQKYYSDYLVWQTAQEMKDTSAKEPTRPDVKQLAEGAGLPYRTTGMIDILQVIRTPLGRSRTQTGEGFAERAFSDSLQLFQPVRTLDFDFTAAKISEFLIWKTEAKKSYVPELSEVRDEVVAVWKKEKAEKLAEAAANDIANKLKASAEADAWKAALEEQQLPLVIKPSLFTWMTGAAQMNPFLSEVEGIDTAGPEFMQKVFSTPAGEVGAAANAPKTIYYAFKAIEFLPEKAELEKRFSEDTIRGSYRALAFDDARDTFVAWYTEIEKELDVQWVTPEDQLN